MTVQLWAESRGPRWLRLTCDDCAGGAWRVEPDGARLDEAGVVQCAQTFEALGSAYLTAIDTDEAGCVYAAGQTWGPGDEYESTPFLLKLDPKGEFLASRVDRELTGAGTWESVAASNQAVYVAGSARPDALPGATLIGPGGIRAAVSSLLPDPERSVVSELDAPLSSSSPLHAARPAPSKTSVTTIA